MVVGSSSDEIFVESVARALVASKLDAIVVGATAAVLQGAPVTTQDVDLLVRRVPRNEAKITAFRKALGGFGRVVVTSQVESLVGPTGQVDLIFDALPADLTFEAVRSRALRICVGTSSLLVASLEDIIRSKRAAGRPKDLAALSTLEDTLRVKRALEQ